MYRPTALSFSLPALALAATVASALLLTGCGSDDAGQVGSDPQEATVETTVEEAGETALAGGDNDGGGDYAFGLEKDQMIEVLEQTYATDNASATWEGNTMILTMDGDATAMAAVSMDCRVVTGMLNEDDLLVISYPNAQVECAEILIPD